MRLNLRKTLVALVCALIIPAHAPAQVRIENAVQLDKTVHDFGDICVSDGPVSCSFTVTNVSSEPMNIFNVVSSCGCTDVKWTRETIPAGKSGSISATYKNNEAPYPFDKSLTVYFSNTKRPVVLRLKGVVFEDRKDLGLTYPAHFGSLGLRSASINGGNVLRGSVKSGQLKVANIGKSPVRISFTDVSKGLKVNVDPNPVPASGTANLSYTVDASGLWGYCDFYATPLVDGKMQTLETVGANPEEGTPGGEAVRRDPDPRASQGGHEIRIRCFVKEDFSALTPEQKSGGPNPVFSGRSTFNFAPVKAGTVIDATFEFRNAGKAPLHIYKADCDLSSVKVKGWTEDIRPGQDGKIRVTLDTSGMQEGEVLIIITLTTNSPLRPYVTLYITGFIK